MALAYFITFSTYGAWLHGTGRGMGSVDREHNRFGEEFVGPDPDRESAARESMSQSAYVLDGPRRTIVCRAIVTLSSEQRWQLLAAHVRTNHVHVVVRADGDPGRVLADMKARASRELTRAGFECADRKRWARHGSTRHLRTNDEVDDKIDYTLNRQGTRMASHDGRQEPRTEGTSGASGGVARHGPLTPEVPSVRGS